MSAMPELEMSFGAYLFSISRARQAEALHELLADVKADDGLTDGEKSDLAEAVHRRFCRLNAAAQGSATSHPLDAMVQAANIRIFIATARDAHQLIYLCQVKLPSLTLLPPAIAAALDFAAGERLRELLALN